MEFLFREANKAGCPRCLESVLDSWKFLLDLKAAIDALAETMEMTPPQDPQDFTHYLTLELIFI